jgi:hypothetical protein
VPLDGEALHGNLSSAAPILEPGLLLARRGSRTAFKPRARGGGTMQIDHQPRAAGTGRVVAIRGPLRPLPAAAPPGAEADQGAGARRRMVQVEDCPSHQIPPRQEREQPWISSREVVFISRLRRRARARRERPSSLKAGAEPSSWGTRGERDRPAVGRREDGASKSTVTCA